MKKFGVIILAAAILSVMALVSCEIETGGTIVVKNTLESNKLTSTSEELNIAKVTIVNVLAPLKPLYENVEIAPKGVEHKFTFAKDGLYTVTYFVLGDPENWLNWPEPFYVSSGRSQTIEIKPKN